MEPLPEGHDLHTTCSKCHYKFWPDERTSDWRIWCPACGNYQSMERAYYWCTLDSNGFFVDDQSYIWAYNGDAVSLVISGDYRGIRAGAFQGARMRTIVVEEGVEDIGSGAFRNCKMLISAHLPNSVKEMGEAVFEGCINLGRVVLPSDLKRIQGTFAGCISLEDVSLPENLEEIGKCSFKNAYLLMDSFPIPRSVKHIGDEAFSYAGLRDNNGLLDLPQGLQSVGQRAFRGCGFKQVILPESLIDIAEEAFVENTLLRTVALPGKTIQIGWSAFADCISLKTVEGGENSLISQTAFQGCLNLEGWPQGNYYDSQCRGCKHFNPVVIRNGQCASRACTAQETKDLPDYATIIRHFYNVDDYCR